MQMTNKVLEEKPDCKCNNNISNKLTRLVYAQGTVDLMRRIFKMEENHINWSEIQRTQIELIGLENHLVNQSESKES
jgi:bacterioferritin (cytochrome b1)